MRYGTHLVYLLICRAIDATISVFCIEPYGMSAVVLTEVATPDMPWWTICRFNWSILRTQVPATC